MIVTDGVRRLVIVSLAGLFVVVLVRTAWMSDDAYITLRTVDNFVSGHGLRWNVVERVQTYTHPLWLIVLTLPFALTREAYFTPIVLQLAISMLTVGLLITRLSASFVGSCLALSALIFSKAFVEYSTSGLENPLSHLLLVLFWIVIWRHPSSTRTAIAPWLVASLVMLNRLDHGLLVLPALLLRRAPGGWRAEVRAAAAGLSPLIAWELFSIVYYGFPFPNTAYAKLQTGITASALIGQGVLYFADSIANDPVTLIVTVAGSALLLVYHRAVSWHVIAGVVLYDLYVVRIGGDFMSGRFLTAPLVCVAAAFVRVRWTPIERVAPVLAAAMVVLGTFATTRPPVTSGPNTFVLVGADGMGIGGVADERAFYYRYTGLLRWTRDIPLPHNEEEVRGRTVKASGQAVAVQSSIGLFGFYAGPGVHVLDPLALGDPLLARLPAEPGWRVGHYLRAIPEGYVATLESGRNVIVESTIAARYERIKAITQGPLWSRRRWRAIVAVNSGG